MTEEKNENALTALPFVGLPLSIAGLSSVEDSKGNTLSGKTLSCKGKDDKELTIGEAKKIYDQISSLPPMLSIAFVGGKATLGDIASPLETACNSTSTVRHR